MNRLIAYLKSVQCLGRPNVQGIPCIPKHLFKGAPFNRSAYNSFIIEASRWKLQPAPVIYDIGANCGDFALAFKRYYPAARLVLFEPLPALAGRLTNLNRKASLDFEIHSCALGAENALMSIEVPDDQPAASSLHGFGGDYLAFNPGASSFATLEVEVRRLDTIKSLDTDMRIDLMKIDVEGFEFEVLRGASGTLRKVCNIVVEVSRLRHANKTRDAVMEMVDLMETEGFLLQRMEPTVWDRTISDFPLEYDLYFSRTTQ